MRKNFGAKPFLYPQPVMILGTYDENGKANAMNAAWGGIVGANEIIVDLSAHKTTDNIIKNKAFTVGVADLEHLVACDYVGIVSANKEAYKMQNISVMTEKLILVNLHQLHRTRYITDITDLENVWEMLLRMEQS